MGIQTMSSQGGSNQFQPLARQGSLYSFTFDEVQNQLGDLGKPLNSMNLEELLKNVWTAEANLDAENAVSSTDQLESAFAPQRQASLTLTRALSKKTVDEVWRDIQQVQNNNTTNEEKKLQEKQPTLGEMTLEDFLVKAGVVAEASVGKKNVIGIDPMSQNFPEQAPQWFQYQPQSPQQNMMGGFIPEHSGASPPLDDVSYVENQMDMSPPLMGTLLDKQRSGRKRVAPGDLVEKTVERRQKRMIKNRESAARSRARKQAYTNELENKVSRLEEENERLKKQKELENILPWVPVPEPKYQLRRTSSATH